MKFPLKTVIVILVLVVFALIALLFQTTFITNKRISERLIENETELNKQLAMASQRDSLLNADEWILQQGDLENSKSLFDKLMEQASPELKQRLEIRLNYIQELISLDQQGSEILSRKDQLIRSQRQRLQLLEAETDSLAELHSEKMSTVQKRLQAVENDKQALEKELSRKEKVKVISFAGLKGTTVHYLGEVVDGKADGGGIGIWTTGSVYRGEWRNNLRHGKGSFQWKNGERYEGNYVDGKREGEGTYYWPSGERYEGQWVADQRTGQGTLFDLDGNVRYKGEWLNDVPANSK